jgi:hypothetical protein
VGEGLKVVLGHWISAKENLFLSQGKLRHFFGLTSGATALPLPLNFIPAHVEQTLQFSITQIAFALVDKASEYKILKAKTAVHCTAR